MFNEISDIKRLSEIMKYRGEDPWESMERELRDSTGEGVITPAMKKRMEKREQRLRSALENKKGEYEKRLETSGSDFDRKDSLYKMLSVRYYLDNGRLDYPGLRRFVEDETGERVMDRDLTRAFGVVTDYIETGGSNVSGGTGFKLSE